MLTGFRFSRLTVPLRFTLTETATKERRIPVNPQFWALNAKDAVVDQFRERHNVRPSVDRKEPDITIRLQPA